MAKVRLGVIGCGVIGRHHLTSAKQIQDIETTAIADVRAEAARAYAEEFRVPHVFPDGRTLIDSGEADAVVLALPAVHRFDLAAAALKRGIPILLEKPVARNADEVQTLLDLQKDTVAACCSSRYRFLPMANQVTKAIADGLVGKLRQIRGHLVRPVKPLPETLPPAWRLNRRLNGGGFMSNWGCYFLDFLLGVYEWQLAPRQVFGQTWGLPLELSDYVPEGSDAEVKLAAHVRMLDGATIDLDLSEYGYLPEHSVCEIHGSTGALRFNIIPEHPSRLFHYTGDRRRGLVETILWEAEQDHQLVHRGVLANFAAAVLGQEAAKTDLNHSLTIQRITDGLYASAADGHSVSLVP